MKDELLELLNGADGYLSGQALSEALGVSRTAVWKAINKLKEDGFQIASVRNKGYLIEKTSTELAESSVRSYLPRASRFTTVKVLESVDSTNTEAKRLYQSGVRNDAIVLSKEQTLGKGRRGRSWLSPKDEGIFMSLLLTPDIDPVQASMLTLVAGLAVAEAIVYLLDLKPMIKWPNDIVIGSKKVCGILTEMSAEMDFVNHVIVGIGINVNQVDFHPDIVDMATSLKEICGQEVNRPQLIGCIIEKFEVYYNQFLTLGDLTFMSQSYNARCINVNQELKVISRSGELKGKGVGIKEDGTLQIRLEDGTITSINAGEVSVRGLYGYI